MNKNRVLVKVYDGNSNMSILNI